MQTSAQIPIDLGEVERRIIVSSERVNFAMDGPNWLNHAPTIYLDLKSVRETFECFA